MIASHGWHEVWEAMMYLILAGLNALARDLDLMSFHYGSSGNSSITSIDVD